MHLRGGKLSQATTRSRQSQKSLETNSKLISEIKQASNAPFMKFSGSSFHKSSLHLRSILLQQVAPLLQVQEIVGSNNGQEVSCPEAFFAFLRH